MDHQVEVCKLLGKNIRRIRLKKNITQNALAEGADISVVALSQIETCKIWPKAEVLQRIIDALKVHPYELFVQNENELEQYKELLISTFVKNLDEQFPTSKKTRVTQYNLTRKHNF